MAERLSGIIPKLVSEDQVGYIRGRNMATVMRFIDDVIMYLNRTKNAGYIFAVDFRKAFDSISKYFLSHVFRAFGFGEDFQKMGLSLNQGHC